MTELRTTSQRAVATPWNSGFVVVLRWLLYLPVGALLIVAIELGTMLFFDWLFGGNLRMLVIVGVLFGGLFTILPFVLFAYYGAITVANKVVCPRPRVGVLIFAVLYGLWSVDQTIGMFSADFGAGSLVTLLTVKLAFAITAAVTIWQVFLDAGNSECSGSAAPAGMPEPSSPEPATLFIAEYRRKDGSVGRREVRAMSSAAVRQSIESKGHAVLRVWSLASDEGPSK